MVAIIAAYTFAEKFGDSSEGRWMVGRARRRAGRRRNLRPVLRPLPALPHPARPPDAVRPAAEHARSAASRSRGRSVLYCDGSKRGGRTAARLALVGRSAAVSRRSTATHRGAAAGLSLIPPADNPSCAAPPEIAAHAPRPSRCQHDAVASTVTSVPYGALNTARSSSTFRPTWDVGVASVGGAPIPVVHASA